MTSQVGTTTICSADALTNAYALMDDDLQTVDGTNKWLQLYGETQTTLEITYTTGAAETSNYVEFYIEFGSGSVGGRPNQASTMTWVRETMEYFDDSADQIVLEEWTYKIAGAAAATAYTKRIQLPVCTKGIRIYAKEVGVVANAGNLTIKANTVAAGSAVYNRNLQTVSLVAGSEVDITKVGGDSVIPTAFRATDLDETPAQAVKASAGNLYGWNFYNPNSYDVFVKFYNTAAGSVTVGTTAVVETVQVPALGSVVIKESSPIKSFSTAIAVAATKLVADNDTTAITSDVFAHIYYV